MTNHVFPAQTGRHVKARASPWFWVVKQWQALVGKLTSRWSGPLAPVSTLGLRATVLKTTAAKPLFRIRPLAKKTFGEAFGAVTVAGSAGPGFHTWPSGHISQDTAAKLLFRIQPPAKKTFGEAFGAATGVSDPRLQKSRGARATTPGPYRYETTTQVS